MKTYSMVQISAHKYIVVQDAGVYSVPSGMPLTENARLGMLVYGPARYADALKFLFLNANKNDEVDVCITGNPAVNGVCGDPGCFCAGGAK